MSISLVSLQGLVVPAGVFHLGPGQLGQPQSWEGEGPLLCLRLLPPGGLRLRLLLGRPPLWPGLATDCEFFSSSFLFVENHWFVWRANLWLLVREKPFSSSQQLPCLCLGPLKSFLSWHGALRLLHCSLHIASITTEKQRHKLCCTSEEVPGHRQKKLTKALIMTIEQSIIELVAIPI